MSAMSMRLVSAFVLACCAALFSLPALAQQPFVPVESYNRTRPDFGNRLPLCVIPNSTTLEQDRRVATELAELLLLVPEVVEMDVDMQALDAEGIWPSIFVHLAEKCVGVLGVQVIAGTQLPDWLTITRPYLTQSYVLVDVSGAGRSFSELPADARLGLPIRTPIDNEILQLIEAGGAFADLRRRPYDRPETLSLLIETGALDAAIVFEPLLKADGFTAFADQAVPLGSPLQQVSRSLGIVLRSQDQMLRGMLDDAIAARQEALERD